MMTMHVGIDLVSVDSVDISLAAHGRRYLRRVYTDDEVADSRHGSTISAAQLAARFAAKEATYKALRVQPDVAVPWTSIELVTDPSGAPELRLTGRAAEIAAAAHVIELAVSVTHEGPFAAAVVIATVSREDRGPRSDDGRATERGVAHTMERWRSGEPRRG